MINWPSRITVRSDRKVHAGRSSELLATQFRSPADAPVGVSHTKTPNGFTAKMPVAEYAIGVIFLMITLALMGLIAIPIQLYSDAVGSAIMIVCGLIIGLVASYFFFGEIELSIAGNELRYKRGLFGIGHVVRIPWKMIKRLSVTREVQSYDWDTESTFIAKPPKIRVETANRRWEFGGYLPAATRQYFRYLIEQHFQEWKNAVQHRK